MRMFQRSVQIPLAPGVTLLLSTAFPKGRSVSEDTFRIYSPNSPGRKKITNHTLANPNPRGTLSSNVKHLVRERWSTERFTAYIHPVHILSPEGSLTWRVLCHFALLLQDFAEDVLSCAGTLSSKPISLQRCCSQWHCCSPPRYCCNFFFPHCCTWTFPHLLQDELSSCFSSSLLLITMNYSFGTSDKVTC